ncbi:MAG: leucine-rich repeat domain-containing protein [Bacteroidales bacterium]|nr:leucine-rich repeat domain-containing protein [Bacteroidales bacterium]
MKRLFLSLILAAICSISAFAYNFSAVSNGKTLYYNITSSSSPYTVEVTYQTAPEYNDNTGQYSSSYSSLSGSLTIPSSVTYSGRTYSVTSIGYYAFFACGGLTSVTIPNSVTSIGDYAFYGVLNVIYNGSATGSPWGARYVNGYVDGNLVYSDNTKTYLIACRTLATEVTIPNSVTSIGNNAFMYCSGLTSVTIPNSVTSIGYNAFRYCSGLTSVIIPNSVAEINDYTFSDCIGLTSITIGNSVTSIGSYAFEGCNGLENISVTEGNATYDSRDNCNAIIETETNTLIVGCKNTIIPNSVTSIGDKAFSDCIGLTSIAIPNSVTSIGNNAFYGCSGLTSVIIPNSVTIIGSYAFMECTRLSNVTIGSSVTSIGEFVFVFCPLTDIYVLASEPPELGHLYVYEFDINVPFDIVMANLWVPCGSETLYRSAENWSEFYNIYGAINYAVILESTNLEMGRARMIQAPDCSTGTAIIEAIATEGFAFLSWQDGNTDNPRTVEINSDTTFTATFAEARTVTVEVADSEMGSVIGSGVYAEGAEIQITAIPNENYRFDHWIDVENPTRDFNTDNPRTIVVSSDVSYIAVFESLTDIDVSFETGIDIFPTTVNEILNITSSEEISTIEIVNVMGQVVYRAEVNADNAVCNVEGLTAGVYVVRIHGTDTASICQKKFVKE